MRCPFVPSFLLLGAALLLPLAPSPAQIPPPHDEANRPALDEFEKREITPPKTTQILPVHDEAGHPIMDEFRKREITPPKAELPVDDYIIALAKAGDANFIADVTKVPSNARVQPFPATPMAVGYRWQPKFYLTMIDFTQQHEMTMLRYDDRTFLFWHEPDPMALAHQIAAKRKAAPNQANVSEDAAFTLLSDYAQRARGWDGVNGNFSFSVPLAELPNELRARLMAFVRGYYPDSVLRPETGLSDEFWQRARVRLGPGVSDKVLNRLYVGAAADEKSPAASFVGMYGLETTPLQRIGQAGAPSPGAKALAQRDILTRSHARYGLTAPPDAPAPNAPAQAAPNAGDLNAAPLAVAPLTVAPLTVAQLAQEPALAAAVSFEAKRLSLREVLARASKAGVTLSGGENAPAELRVTARVHNMPLASLMGSLSRLSGVAWSKQADNHYVLSGGGLDEVQLGLLQRGHPLYYKYRATVQPVLGEYQERLHQLALGIVDAAGEALRSPQGVAVADLPDELRAELRRVYERSSAGVLVWNEYTVTRALSPQCVLQFRTYSGLGQAADGTILTPQRGDPFSVTIGIYSPDGKTQLIPIAQNRMVQPPRPDDAAQPDTEAQPGEQPKP